MTMVLIYHTSSHFVIQILVTSIVSRLDGLWEAVEPLNSVIHRLTKEAGGKWIDVGQNIDPDHPTLFSTKDGIHLSDAGVALFITEVDLSIAKSLERKKKGRLPTWLILPSPPPRRSKGRKKGWFND